MGQSKRDSAVESVTNVAVGFLIALLTQMAIFPLFGIQSTLPENLGIAFIFTAVSLVRSYALRRIFNKVGGR